MAAPGLFKQHEYTDLDFKHADFRIVQRGRNERIDISWSPRDKCYVAISATCPEVYYRVDLLCDSSGFCTVPASGKCNQKNDVPVST